VKLGREILHDLNAAASREWLLADGLGGYASSTTIGMNTRRYHGLLVAATKPPVGRMVLLSRLDEALTIGERRYELSTNAYGGTIHPRGFEHAHAFALDPLPVLTFELPEGRLTRTLARTHGEPGLAIVYAWEGASEASLELRPLVAFRDHHALQRENAGVRGDVELRANDVVLRPYDGCPELHLRVPLGRWASDGYWYRGFSYAQEEERGFEYREDLFSHGRFEVTLRREGSASLLAWMGAIPPMRDAAEIVAGEKQRLRALGAGEKGLFERLKRAAGAFLVKRGDSGLSVIAGYHWFSDWGRDTMISLPGLLLSTGRFEEARAVLREFARHVAGGLIPNRFPDEGDPPEYNTVDAALWMIVAVQRYLEAAGDREFVLQELAPAVFSIVDGYRGGTRHGIGMTADGLVTQGEEGLALTWMDARVLGRPVTPRHGLAIEIQALWYNALLTAAELARERDEGGRASEYLQLASRARDAVLRQFWAEDLGYLADVVAGGVRDLKVRPNQLYAIGLPNALLPREKAERVLQVVKEQLLTPVGLRTLSPLDPEYRPQHRGGPLERDAAYHQGTIWPFLMGVYFDALVRIFGEDGKREARDWLSGFARHLEEAGLGYVSEVFDGDPPHRPGGAIAQAWSVAELLRLAVRLRRLGKTDPDSGV
jgi:predicted glycogen debranching enzyme